MDTTEKKSSKMKIIVGLIVVALIALGGYMYFSKMKVETKSDLVTTVEPVATVNGVNITQEAFDSQLAASITALKAQGVDLSASTTDAQLRVQVLNDLINTELVNQGIKATNTGATAQEIEAQFQALVTQLGGTAKLQEELTKAQLTEAKLRENITRQLTVQKYLSANVNVASTTVTDAEIKKFYDDNTKGQTGVPALKDVKEQIRQQLLQQKQQVLINAFLETLRAKAKIETKLK
jgi:hypothetical protein